MSFSEPGAFGRGHGCGCSVLVSAFLTACAFAIFSVSSGDGGLAGVAFVVAFIGSVFVIGLSAGILGLPLTQLLESNGWERPWSYPLAGFVLGAVIVYIFIEAVEPPSEVSPEGLAFLLIGAVPGAFCGALWWLLERRHFQRGDSNE